jgi:hypothetical protein|tara:strand:- start:1212 stop:2024 length:813 start_codon:yes stop_codon:yes gene_type:complete
MSGAFKTIATKNITRHTAHKSYAISIVDASGSFDGLEVFFYQGVQNTQEYGTAPASTTNDYDKRDVWDSINTNFYKKVEGPPGEGGGFQGHVDSTFKGSKRIVLATIGSIAVISIPHLMIGDGIKPGSVKVDIGSSYWVDDLDGNLTWSADAASVTGNVFYSHGIIVINTSSDTFKNCTLTFKNTHVIEEHEYMCNATKHEFNATTNQSVLSDIANGTVAGFVSSSAFNPYVTTVGLYDDNSNLLAIGKLGQAIKKSEKFDTSYVIRFDT